MTRPLRYNAGETGGGRTPDRKKPSHNAVFQSATGIPTSKPSVPTTQGRKTTLLPVVPKNSSLVTCFHTKEECVANRLQRCVQAHYPAWRDWLAWSVCVNGNCTGKSDPVRAVPMGAENGTRSKRLRNWKPGLEHVKSATL